MEHIKHLAQASLEKAATPHLKILKTPREMLSTKLIDQLFVRFQSNYGNKFSSQFANENMIEAAKKEWGYALSPYDGEVFSYAIREMQKHYPEWPPTPGQFIELCKKYYREKPALDPPKLEKGNAIIGNEALKKIRESLGVKGK